MKRFTKGSSAGDNSLARFADKMVVDQSGCWLWLAGTKDGYGLFTFKSKIVGAHRWIYEQLVGIIPLSMFCDHRCCTRNCVNPSHIELVSRSENTKRAFLDGRHNYRQTGRKVWLDMKRKFPFGPVEAL